MPSPSRSARSAQWILVGTILGSGAVFVEGSVTIVALPAIARDFHLGIAGLLQRRGAMKLRRYSSSLILELRRLTTL